MEDFLTELFPEAKINGNPQMGEKYFSVPFENKWFHFPLNSITEREMRLIQQIAIPETVSQNPPENPWAHFLLEESNKIPTGYDEVQLLQFVIKITGEEDNFDQRLWLDAFQNTLDFIKDGFFTTKHAGVLILNNPSRIDLLDEIDGVLNVLDDDFGVLSNVYLGQSWEVTEELPALFREEQQIFQENHSTTKRTKISRLPKVALTHYTRDSVLHSPILHRIKAKTRSTEGGQDLILSMWDNQGNISKAAADLYVHRNTLQYRLDRFFEATGLNLKNMDDLLLGYLAVNARIDVPLAEK